MSTVLTVADLSKSYSTGLVALKGINLSIEKGEIFALLGPNGAGKTTLINVVCGIVVPSTGTVTVDGYDIRRDYRITRSKSRVPNQCLSLDLFRRIRSRGWH